MLFVLDSNEYLFALGALPKPASQKLLDRLIETYPTHHLRIPRLIIEEVRRHLSSEAFRELLNSIRLLTSVDEDFVVPFELGAKYEAQGLKPADAFIAAYTEWVGAHALVTENRHFLTRHTGLPFRVLTAERCLKLL
jgi:predicted nucleic acid-binding protein